MVSRRDRIVKTALDFVLDKSGSYVHHRSTGHAPLQVPLSNCQLMALPCDSIARNVALFHAHQSSSGL